MTIDGRHAESVVDIQVRIKTPPLNDKDFDWETGQKKPKAKETDNQLEITL